MLNLRPNDKWQPIELRNVAFLNRVKNSATSHPCTVDVPRNLEVEA